MCNDLLVIYPSCPFLILYEILSINYLYPALFLESPSAQMTLLINYQSCTFLFSDTRLVSSPYFMYGQTGILELLQFFIPSIELGPCAQLLKSPVGFFPLIYVFKLFLYRLPTNIQITIKGRHSHLGPLTFGASET